MKTNITLGCIVLVVSFFVACTNVDIEPDPATSSASSSGSESTSSSSNASSGNGGTGGAHMGAGGNGGTCNPCTNQNGSRIVAKLKTTSTPDGLHWETQAGWRDNELAINCKPLYAEDKQLRCMPADAIMVTSSAADPANYMYADPFCKDRIIEGYIPTCMPPFAYALESFGSQLQCLGQPYRVYSLNTGVQSVQAYKKMGVQCVQMAGTITGFYVNQVLPATTFAAMTETIAP